MSDVSPYSVRHLQDEMASGLNETQRQVLTIQKTSGKRLDELLSEMCRVGLDRPAGIRSMLAETHGLAADNIDFLVDLAERADAAALDRDKHALKQAFTYRSYSHDLWQVLLDDVERPFFAALDVLGLPLYWSASEFLIDCYYEKGALEPIVGIYSGQRYRFIGVYEELLNHLEAAKRFDLIEHLWTSVARLTRAEFFSQRPLREHGQRDAVEEHKRLALEAYAHAIDWMERAGRGEAVERLTAERDALQEERFAALPPVSDLRRMDEPVFWELLARVRAGAPTTLEQIALLGELLRGFKPAEIKRFGALYARHMKQLYHWNVWALAYAARGGCSDDAFQEFRSWLILQGDPALVALAVTAPARAALSVPADPDLPDGSCIWMIEEAYLQRQGTPLTLPSTDLSKPKGKEWPEDRIEERYPALVRHYASAQL